MHYRQVFFIRAHLFPEFISDTIDTIRYYSTTDSLIVVTVDRNKDIERVLKPLYPSVKFFTSSSNCGWGGGLWLLFCEALCWLTRTENVSFDYLWNVDYDWIAIAPAFDSYFTKKFSEDKNIGQIGRHSPNSAYWTRRVKQRLRSIKEQFAAHGKPFPRNYKPGEHVAGACSVFKGSCASQMLSMGLLDRPFRDFGLMYKIADDPMLSMMTNAAGYRFCEMGEKAYIKWRLDEDYKKLQSRGFLCFHPTKLTPGNTSYSAEKEMVCRNYFRELRGQSPIVLLPDSPLMGKPNSVTC